MLTSKSCSKNETWNQGILEFFICVTIFLKNIYFYTQKNPISPFFEASENNNIGATIRIGREIRCLPYAGFWSSIP